MNQITHWLDASNIYGSSNFDSRLLRSFTGGRLKDTKPKGPRSSSRPTSKNVLPTCAKESKTNRENIGMCKKCKHCFFAGKEYYFFPFANCTPPNSLSCLILE